MSTTTQCPVCGTRFKASQAQLEAYHGMVRCGHCHAAFNALENRSSADTSPQLDLPIVLEDLSPPQASPAVHGGLGDRAAETDFAGKRRDPASESREFASEGHDQDRDGYAAENPAEKRRTWPWAFGSMLLLGLLAGQATYLFRVELGARLPGLKPALVEACEKLHCSVPLPRNADLMSIESSNLETDPAQPGVITLTVTLRNHASYGQDYPNLELTLTDLGEAPVGRRVLRPGEYLKDAEDGKNGLAGNRETTIRLAIDASGLKASGYRLYLFY